MKYIFWFLLVATYGDFIHRFGYHRVKWMRRIHAVHHRAYAFKFHPIEYFFNWGLPYIVSLPFMGFWFCNVALLAVIFESNRGHDGNLNSVRVPKNLYKIPIGWVTRGYHKQHHINERVAYGQITDWWDRVFKTLPNKNITSIS